MLIVFSKGLYSQFRGIICFFQGTLTCLKLLVRPFARRKRCCASTGHFEAAPGVVEHHHLALLQESTPRFECPTDGRHRIGLSQIADGTALDITPGCGGKTADAENPARPVMRFRCRILPHQPSWRED